jgi:phage shock protein A
VSAGFDLPGGESMAAALRRAEQERDEERAEVERLVDLAWKAIRERDAALDELDLAREALDQADDAELECTELRDEVSGVRASLAELADEVEDLKGTLAMRTGQLMASRRHVQHADAERDLARAELESARQELDAIRRREAGAT